MLPPASVISGLGLSRAQQLTSHCQGRAALGPGPLPLCANQGAATRLASKFPRTLSFPDGQGSSPAS